MTTGNHCFVFFFITTLIQLWCYIVSIHLFYIINRFIDHNIYRFYCYPRKEGNFIVCFGKKLVPTIKLIYLKSLYESYLPLSILYVILFFSYSIYNQISDATATVVTTVACENGKSRNFGLLLDRFNFFDLHKVIA